MILYFILLCSVHGAMYMEQQDKHFLETHPIEFSHVDIDDVKSIVHDEYRKMSMQCILPNANIEIIYDDTLIGSSVLAWASQNMKLIDGVWKPSVFADVTTRHFTIAFNPSPPNGWFIDDCKYIYHQYDLRTVIRHELLHGIGLGSSITFDNGWTSGVETSGFCFPRMYDTFIVDQDGNNILNRCQIVDISNKKLYIGDVELYHPDTFRPGSSLSHHNYPGYLFYYKSTHSKCMGISKYEASMLRHFQVHCSVSAGRKSKISPILLYFLILRILVSVYL